MLYQSINCQKTGYVMVININVLANEQLKLEQLSDELADLCDKITSDEEIRVIVITGVGEGFFSMAVNSIEPCSWANLEYRLETKCASLAETIAKLDRPVIGAIKEDIVGQGFELALACDIRIAADTSRFGLPQIKSGMMPRDGGTQRLSRVVGKSKALEMVLTGEMIDAQEAYRIGLVNKVVPPDKLMTAAMDVAKEMASKGPIALKYAKEAIYKGMDMTLEQGLRLEADLYLLLHTTEDRTEGIKAFQERKSPKFKGE